MVVLLFAASRLKSALIGAFPLKPNTFTQMLLKGRFRHLLRALNVWAHYRLVFTLLVVRANMLVGDLNGAAKFIVFALELSLTQDVAH